MKGINNAILMYIISLVFFTLLSVVLVVYLTKNYISNSIRSVYVEKDFMIDVEPRVNKVLDKVSDSVGKTLDTNHVYVTNNGQTRSYQIRIEPINSDDEDIRVNLDNRLIRSLSKFKKDGNSYILYEGVLNKGISFLHKVGFWQNSESKKDNLKIDFKIKVQIIDEWLMQSFFFYDIIVL